MIAGYFGGWIDDVITRLMEAVRAIPQIILAMALTAVLEAVSVIWQLSLVSHLWQDM